MADPAGCGDFVTTAAGAAGARAFLVAAMDAHSGSSRISLAQSWSDEAGSPGTAFTHDNALAILALLACADRESVIRARRLGEALLYAQENDAHHDDGRLRRAYQASAFVGADGTAQAVPGVGTDTRDMAWAGLAFIALAERLGGPRYSAAAARIGEWIERNVCVPGRSGGYVSGVDQQGRPTAARLTSCNVDLVAFFGKLATLLDDSRWAARSTHARRFALSRWNPEAGCFDTGTGEQVLAGIQTSAYLAMPAYVRALDWTVARHAVTDHADRPNSTVPAGLSFDGVAYSTASTVADETAVIGASLAKPNRSAVWFEGTAQLALAMRTLGNDRVADRLLASLTLAQDRLGHGQTINSRRVPERVGLVAASSPVDTGLGFACYPYLNVGATAWYLLAMRMVNPLR